LLVFLGAGRIEEFGCDPPPCRWTSGSSQNRLSLISILWLREAAAKFEARRRRNSLRFRYWPFTRELKEEGDNTLDLNKAPVEDMIAGAGILVPEPCYHKLFAREGDVHESLNPWMGTSWRSIIPRRTMRNWMEKLSSHGIRREGCVCPGSGAIAVWKSSKLKIGIMQASRSIRSGLAHRLGRYVVDKIGALNSGPLQIGKD